MSNATPPQILENAQGGTCADLPPSFREADGSTRVPQRKWRDETRIRLAEAVMEGDADAQLEIVRTRVAHLLEPQELANLGLYTTGTHCVTSGLVAVTGDAVLNVTGDDVIVFAFGNARVVARGRAKLFVFDDVQLSAFGHCQIDGRDRAKITANDDVNVTAFDSVRGIGRGHSKWTVYGASASIDAYDYSEVIAPDGAPTLRGYNFAHIKAHKGGRATVFDRAKGWFDGDVTAEARGDAIVWAARTVRIKRLGNSQVLPLRPFTEL